MIKISTLAENLTNCLNDALDASDIEDFIESYAPNTKYRFNIFAGEGEYKHSEEKGNEVTVYINGVLKLLPGAKIEGMSDDNYVGTASATLEILVPHADIVDEDGTALFVEFVRNVVSSVMGNNRNSTITDDGTEYLVAMEFSMPHTYGRQLRHGIGDSVELVTSINYAFVAAGVPSQNIEIKIDGHMIYPTKIGISRRAITEPNVKSDSPYGAAACTVSGTALTIAVVLVMRNNAIFTALAKHVITGEFEPFEVELSIKIGKETISKIYKKMTFSESELNGEVPLGASTSFILVEVI